jgi:hypothetical protein
MKQIVLDSCTLFIDRLAGKRYFAKFDLGSGYHQVRVGETDVPNPHLGHPSGTRSPWSYLLA